MLHHTLCLCTSLSLFPHLIPPVFLGIVVRFYGYFSVQFLLLCIHALCIVLDFWIVCATYTVFALIVADFVLSLYTPCYTHYVCLNPCFRHKWIIISISFPHSSDCSSQIFVSISFVFCIFAHQDNSWSWCFCCLHAALWCFTHLQHFTCCTFCIIFLHIFSFCLAHIFLYFALHLCLTLPLVCCTLSWYSCSGISMVS